GGKPASEALRVRTWNHSRALTGTRPQHPPTVARTSTGMKPHHLLLFTCLATTATAQDFHQRLADSALVLIEQQVRYDPSYFKLAYPNGDVPPDKGVCTDVVIRAYRKLGIDLQK